MRGGLIGTKSQQNLVTSSTLRCIQIKADKSTQQVAFLTKEREARQGECGSCAFADFLASPLLFGGLLP